MDVSDAKRLKTRGAQNARLKRLLAAAMLETPDHAVVNAPP